MDWLKMTMRHDEMWLFHGMTSDFENKRWFKRTSLMMLILLMVEDDIHGCYDDVLLICTTESTEKSVAFYPDSIILILWLSLSLPSEKFLLEDMMRMNP